jgi:hypothetical protein
MKHGGPPMWDAMVRLVQHVEPALAAARLSRPHMRSDWEAVALAKRLQAARFLGGLAGLS